MLLTSSLMIDGIILLGIVFILSYIYSTRRFNYWKKRHVYHKKPIPFFGNYFDIFTLKKAMGDWFKDAYIDAGDEPYFGIFALDEPILVIRKPELIEHVLVKDFNNFVDKTMVPPEHHPTLKNFVFFSSSPGWKSKRAHLTPSLTSGRLKMMFPVVKAVGDRFREYLNETNGLLEAKEVSAKFTTDVIAQCFFGVHAHSFDDENAMFRSMGRKIFEFSMRNAFVTFAYTNMKNVARLLKLDIFDSKAVQYFTDSFAEVYEARQKSGQRMNDFIDIVSDLGKSENYSEDYKLDRIKAAGAQFLIAGFETTSITISYTLYELALNKDVQNKVRQEILESIKQNDGLTYEGLSKMEYLNMCIKETLRKHPTLPFLDRKAMNDYKLPGTDLVIEKGTAVYIPVSGLHSDEQYFPEPEKYIPERFDGTINHNGNGLVFLPFGGGPRSCFGQRFGVLSSKMGIITVLMNFEVEKCDQTPEKIDLEPKSVVPLSKIGLPIVFKPLVSS